MYELIHKCQSFLKDERGLSAVEYVVAGSLIIVLLVAGFTTLGTTVDGKLSFLNGKVE
ncbi:Flp family type IVb pilin [Vibrio diazotrophicus]|uniref:Flp family type IVb pilin n=1 Tax=Vibrio diazotrophicus TaxID=685 RepID=UPI0022AF1253|nr:Flp family type IVb pilin [Vibrio diazotrophicus]MCZ4373008.1 Flp family type IVb pilin [Vibrio diazotrophicus]